MPTLAPFRPALLLSLALGAALAAPKGKSPADSAAIPAKGHSHMECMADSGEMAALRKSVQDALKSGDAAKMKAALEQVDGHLATMQDRMEKCKARMGHDGEGKAMMDGDGDMMCGKEHGEAKGADGRAKHHAK